MNRHARIEHRANVPDDLSIDAFFAWVEYQPERYELVEGTPMMQPWVKRGHSIIVGNIDFLMRSGLDRQAFRVHQGDFAIETGPASIRYADLLVEPAGRPSGERTTKDALLIVEVLSETTMHLDFGAKRLEYLNLPSLETYVVVAQDTRCLWLWERGEDGAWPDDPLLIAEGELRLDRLATTLALDAIYDGVL